MTNSRKRKAPEDISPCPLCEEPMESPTLDPATGKSTTTKCAKCGTTRTIMVGEDRQARVWN